MHGTAVGTSLLSMPASAMPASCHRQWTGINKSPGGFLILSISNFPGIDERPGGFLTLSFSNFPGFDKSTEGFLILSFSNFQRVGSVDAEEGNPCLSCLMDWLGSASAVASYKSSAGFQGMSEMYSDKETGARQKNHLSTCYARQMEMGRGTPSRSP